MYHPNKTRSEKDDVVSSDFASFGYLTRLVTIDSRWVPSPSLWAINSHLAISIAGRLGPHSVGRLVSI